MNQNSLDAYRKQQEVRGSCRRAVYEEIKKHKAITAKEIAKKLGWPINTVTPRLCELRERGMIVEGGHVKNDNNYTVTLYSPVTEGGII